MFALTRKPVPARLTLRVLAALLGYPSAELRAAGPELADALRAEQALPAARIDELLGLIAQLGQFDAYELESRYVETFDRGRKTSLHLFEHIHGDSRDRGPALVDLHQTYARAGLECTSTELPDYLPAVLEFASTQPPEIAREFLAELAHIVAAVFSALLKDGSPYASVLAAVIELAGQSAQAVPVADEPPLDEAWAEPPAFDGCSSAGRAAPSQPQPIHIVRKSIPDQGVRA